MDPVGSKFMVKGNKIDKVEAGPKPGKTPTRVPTTQPAKQYNRFDKVNTFIIPLSRSIFSFSPHEPTYNAMTLQQASGYQNLIEKLKLPEISSRLTLL
jgi:hypothetical protein